MSSSSVSQICTTCGGTYRFNFNGSAANNEKHFQAHVRSETHRRWARKKACDKAMHDKKQARLEGFTTP